MSVSVDDSILGQLNTAEAKALHDVSESLTSCGVGKIVNLPQIVVVGDQSSGKSSVLEAISGVKFPVEGGLCTRFATELVLRQAPEMRVKVNIRFADTSKSSHCFQRTDFSQDDLPEIITEAKECMGFSKSGQQFSKDVLRLEIEGPKMYPLTLVDLPGLFHADTETQSLSGKQTVDQLVESYIMQRNSIILVVITANQQLASHDALRRVKMFDPQRERTLGVITKPDLSGLANETHYVRVAKNEESANRLKYGWHVLRNRAENETDSATRDQVEEKFFTTGSWASIPKQDVGIASFRKKLSKVLYEHLRTSLPAVVDDIKFELQSRQDALAQLGDPRSNVGDMRSFLLNVAGDFQHLARDGAFGRYNDPFFGDMDDESRKLRALLRNFSRVFEHVVRTKGCQKHITEDGEPPEEEELPLHLLNFVEKHPYEFEEPETIDVDDLQEELERQASANQGREFPGTANHELAMQLFRKQASPWKPIAEHHIEQVTNVARQFAEDIFEHILGPSASSHATETILTGCVDPFFREIDKTLRSKLTELLAPYAEGYACPPDVELKQAMKRQSFGRLMDRVCDVLEENRPDLFERDYSLPLTREMLLGACAGEDIEDSEFGASKVVHMMLAYYEPSRRTFTDNVVNLAVESCLVRKLPDILTPAAIGKMSDERLKELAAESEESQSRRKQLMEELEVLENGLSQCRKYRPRNVTGPSMSSPSRSRDESSLPPKATTPSTPPVYVFGTNSENPPPPAPIVVPESHASPSPSSRSGRLGCANNIKAGRSAERSRSSGKSPQSAKSTSDRRPSFNASERYDRHLQVNHSKNEETVSIEEGLDFNTVPTSLKLPKTPFVKSATIDDIDGGYDTESTL